MDIVHLLIIGLIKDVYFSNIDTYFYQVGFSGLILQVALSGHNSNSPLFEVDKWLKRSLTWRFTFHTMNTNKSLSEMGNAEKWRLVGSWNCFSNNRSRFITHKHANICSFMWLNICPLFISKLVIVRIGIVQINIYSCVPLLCHTLG